MDRLLALVPPWLLPAVLVLFALYLMQPVLLKLIEKLGNGAGKQPDLARALDRLALVLENALTEQRRTGDAIRETQEKHTEVLHRLDYRTREIRDQVVGGASKGAD